jgi:hypothetical protein
MRRILTEPELAATLRERGLAQSRQFDWHAGAAGMLARFSTAVAATRSS